MILLGSRNKIAYKICIVSNFNLFLIPELLFQDKQRFNCNIYKLEISKHTELCICVRIIPLYECNQVQICTPLKKELLLRIVTYFEFKNKLSLCDNFFLFLKKYFLID